MVPHKTARGAAALARFKAYEGIPAPYDKVKRAVVPDALKALRLQTQHKFTTLGRLAKERGWKQFEAVKMLEARRKEASKAFYVGKKKAVAERAAAMKKANLAAPVKEALALVQG